MELREPKRKRRVRIALQQPFPVLNKDITSLASNRELWQVYTGRYSGDFVVVDAPDEMAALHNMGFFGKGSLSRGAPEFGKERQGTPPFVRQRQWERRCRWAEQQEQMIKQFNEAQKKAMVGHTTHAESTAKPDKVEENRNKEVKKDNMDDDVITLDSAEEDNGSKTDDKLKKDEKSETEKQNTSEECGTRRKRMLVVLPDSDDDDYEQYLANIHPRLEKEPFPIHESLHLTLEESFFLSYGLGCLQVIDMFGNCLPVDRLWQLFCKSQKDFIQKYVAYHYFRSKGWVVKPGIKFGGDFLLYKQGPPFYHASYIIVVQVVDSATLKRHPAVHRTLTWTKLMGLNRLAETAGKEVILCQIMWPSGAGPASLEFPSVLSKFQVHEVLVRRWVSSQEREENDTL